MRRKFRASRHSCLMREAFQLTNLWPQASAHNYDLPPAPFGCQRRHQIATELEIRSYDSECSFEFACILLCVPTCQPDHLSRVFALSRNPAGLHPTLPIHVGRLWNENCGATKRA